MAKDKKAQAIIEEFESYKGIQSSWSSEIQDDREFVNNDQWEVEVASSLEAANQPVVVNNEMKPARDQVIQQITDNSPRWMAVARENSDTTVAGSFSDLGSYIWDRSRGDMHFTKSTEDLEDTGIFILHAYVNPAADDGQPEIELCRVNPQDVFLDPACTWRNAQDSEKIFVSNVLSENRIKTLYPDFDFKDAVQYKFSMRPKGSRDIREGRKYHPDFLPGRKYYRIIDCYEKVKVDRLWVYDPSTSFEKIMTEEELNQFREEPATIRIRLGEEVVVTDPVLVENDLRMVRQYGNTFHYLTDGSIQSGTESSPRFNGQTMIYPVQGSTTRIEVINMGKLIDDKYLKTEPRPVDRIKRSMLIGEKLYYEEVMPITNYPFGITMLHHTDTPYPYGDARLAKSIQEQINKTHSLIIAYHINLTNVKVFVGQGTNKKELKENWGKPGAQVFDYNQEDGPPVIVQLTAMSSALYQHIDRLKFLIQRIYGVYEFQDGNVAAAPQTKGGTLLIDEMGFRRSKAKLKLIEGALNDLGSVISELIPYVYRKRKIIRIIKPNNKIKEVMFNYEDVDRIVNDLTVNKFDLKIVSGSTLPSNRQARFENILQLYQLGAIRNPEPLLRQTDLPDIDEIMQNEDRLREAEQIAMQLQEALKDMDGQLQSVNRELIHKDRKVELEKFKAKLAQISARLEQSQLLSQYRLSDLVKEEKQKVNEKEKVQ